MAKATTMTTTISTTTTTTTTTKRSRQNFRFTVRWLTICLLCGTTFNCLVNCQIDEERQQESLHKYQQLQYQIQQQQQLQYQQQMQQQQQYYQQQQHQLQQQQQQQQQQELLQPISLALQSNENVASRLPTTQMQMLKTGASLIVTADGSMEAGQNESYTDSDTQQIASRRSSSVNGRKRKRRPDTGTITYDDNEDKQYWRGHVDDDKPSNNENNQEELNKRQKTRRRKQPAVREPLAALEKEQKLYEIRDKQRQEFGEGAITKNRDKSYRRPYSQVKKDQENTTPTAISYSSGSKSASDLKHILKNSGGLSLSEILQQKNLSLDDLLKGKQNALLALQTTAASPNSQKSDNYKNLKPARRIPSSYLSAELENNSGEQTSSEEVQGGRNRLKFPTLNRLKLFGTPSRATAIPLPGIIDSGSKKRETTSTTTSTPKPSTTTRLPIYKKRAHQRPTLKPLLRFKVTTEPTPIEMQTTRETTTTSTTKSSTTSNKPFALDYESEFTETEDNMDFEDTMQVPEEENTAHDEVQMPTTIETTTIDHVSIMTTMPTTISSILTTSTRTTTTSTSTSTSTSTTSKPITISTTTASNSSSRSNKYEINPKQRTRSKFRGNLKSNSIEVSDIRSTQISKQETNHSRENIDSENSSSEFDDLEDFFDDKSEATNKREHENEQDTTVESITSRIDRTHRYHVSSPIPSSTTRRMRTTTTTTSTTTAEPPEEELPDFDGIDDRTDLLELIEDRRSGNRLFKVLQQRNMTLDQLIEHRKRGSSQLHLATIVEQNARSQFFPGQKVVLHDNMDIVTAFENFPHFNLLNLKSVKPDDIKTDSQGSSYFTSIIDIEPTDEIYKNDKSTDNDGSLRGPMYTQQSPRTDKSLGFFPSWKTLALASLTSTTKGNPFFLPQPKLLLDESNSEELKDPNLSLSNETSASNEELNENTKFSISANNNVDDTAEAIENEVARAHDLLDLELSGHAFKRSPAASTLTTQRYSAASSLYSNMPAGIRSAIVASAAIVLTSMATFLVIFVVCRLKQRKRSKTNYLRTYNTMKSKIPQTTASGLTTTSLGKLSTASASNSRRSSLRNSIVEDLISSGGGANEMSSSLMNVATISMNTNQRPNELLFPRRDTNADNTTNQALLKTCTKNLFYGRRVSSLSGRSRNSFAGDVSNNNGDFGSITGSTSSLALSLRSAHNISSTKLNTMDPNSPEVQEYLFDTLRKSFK